MGDFATLSTARGVMKSDPADTGADFRVTHNGFEAERCGKEPPKHDGTITDSSTVALEINLLPLD
jgi:hypothetical protein